MVTFARRKKLLNAALLALLVRTSTRHWAALTGLCVMC